ncbi:phospho-sugar mutase [Naasia aerilata]|uniref:Phosphomannomutase n=1 Tax=Naasia aerilata TaxID=1162966 RepID=A0ABN6XQ99_9MICO|nr:phospho-sugar mutase [Naasia aerilata]BDZ45856.1 putative phosphomannomutase [Naasia aerilata]
MSDEELIAAAGRWIAQDPDEETRAELEALVDAARDGDESALADLHDRFDTRLTFGTAGLRGALGGGSNRMNRVVVAQTTAGLARFLLAREATPSVVIGYDGRKNSDVFARDVAEILTGAGVRAVLLPRLLPTPVLAFAVRHLDVSAGVMVTASHNPAQDNGYKLYLGGDSAGSQIVPPADREVLGAIEDILAEGPADALPRSANYATADESVVDAYVEATAARRAPAAELTWVYTPMHGVGWDTAARVFERAGIPAPHTVDAQLQPDGTFPTVAFPNPEEAGALDLALSTADQAGADVVVANDPDADRLAAAVRRPDGNWRTLSGNDLGLLLGWAAAERAQRDGFSGTLAASLVSTPGLQRIAEHYGLGYAETLTGFKWISRVPGLLFGFEEALGFLVDPEKVRDKDGISAAVALLDQLLSLSARGSTLDEHQREFDATFGCFTSAQISLRVTRLEEIGAAMAKLRSAPPQEIGGIAVERLDDLAHGGALPPSDVLRFQLAEGARLIARPSGTEPKLKLYLDVAARTGSVEERRARAADVLARLTAGARDLIS